jgi:hypothetical protein
LGCTLALFAPYVRAPLLLYRNAIFSTLDIDGRIDDIATAAAQVALKHKRNHRSIERFLLRARNAPAAPLPPQLINAAAEKRVAYHSFSLAKTKFVKRTPPWKISE